MNYNNKKLLIILLIIISAVSKAQIVLTEEQVVEMALKNSYVINAAELQVEQQKQLRGTGFNLHNPEVVFEKPNTDHKKVEFSQDFDFPSVYFMQGKLLKQRVVLAELNKELSEAELRQKIKALYLELQYLNALHAQFRRQDSIYNNIAVTAKRQFDAGLIDYVASAYAASQYGEINMQYLQIQTDATLAMRKLQLFAGIKDSIVTSALIKKDIPALLNSISVDSLAISQNLPMQYHLQQNVIAKRELQLERHRALPGFTVGYIYEGVNNSEPSGLQAGITIPLWFWQYSSAIKAAKTNVIITEQNMLARQRDYTEQMQQLQAGVIKYYSTLAYYETTGLSLADDLANSSGRMFTAGQVDYITYMRTLTDAYNIRLKYIETLRNFNQAVININYLNEQ